MNADIDAWRTSGRFMPTASGEIFVRTTPGEGPLVVLLHGYPSSSFDWRFVLDALADRATLTLDFLGFGLSAKPAGHRYTLAEQADIVAQAVTQSVARTGHDRVVVIAHDMGTSVATELMARDLEAVLPFTLEQVVLSNGSVIVERASLRPIQKALRSPVGPVLSRLSNERMFTREFAALFSKEHRLRPDEARAQWALVANNNGHRRMHELIAYIGERIELAPRWHGAIRDWQRPASFLWGTADTVATTNVLAGLIELRPQARVTRLDGIGHYPQLEVPTEYTAAALDLLGI